MHDDVYQMYLDEIAAICPMDAAEEEQLIQKLKSGDTTVRSRLMEGYLPFIAETAKSYADQGLPIGDLVQEANMALIMAVDQYQDGDFKSQVKALAEEMIKAALSGQVQLAADAGFQLAHIDEVVRLGDTGFPHEIGRAHV